MNILSFELRRAATAAFSPWAVAALLLTSAIFAGLVAGGRRILGPSLDQPTSMAVIGALWAMSACVTVNERNRHTLIEDVWWWKEPRPVRQAAQIGAAWLAVALVQGGVVAAVIALSSGFGTPSLAPYAVGFVAAAPLGLLLGAIARATPGATLAMGLISMTALFFLGPVSEAFRTALTALDAGAWIGLCGYVAGALCLWSVVASRAPR